jgi:hypothetical protein
LPKAPAHEPMTQSVYNIVKEPLGWSIFCDGLKSGGAYGSKEAALEAAAVAAALALRDGVGIQINVPSARLIPAASSLIEKYIGS